MNDDEIADLIETRWRSPRGELATVVDVDVVFGRVHLRWDDGRHHMGNIEMLDERGWTQV